MKIWRSRSSPKVSWKQMGFCNIQSLLLWDILTAGQVGTSVPPADNRTSSRNGNLKGGGLCGQLFEPILADFKAHYS